MNKVLQYITVSLILLVAFACEEDININGDHQAILNVHFMKDSTQAYWMQIEPVANNAIIASLHQSLDITDTVSAHRKLENARIEIYSDNELITSIEPENELYTSEAWVPVEGKTYQVYGYANGYPVLSGECQVPYTVPFEMNYNYSNTFSNEGGSRYHELEVFLDISDPPNHNNFYFINTRRVDSNTFTIFDILSLDPFIEEGNILSDEFFNGDNHTIHFKFKPFALGLNEGGDIMIELWSISESYYNIFKSMYKYHFANRDDMYAEPVQIFSNVNNGLGVISASAVSRDTIRIPDQL